MSKFRGLKFLLGIVALMTTASLSLSVLAGEKVDIYGMKSDEYKALYKDNVGLSQGAGPFKDFYKPSKLHMYWSPMRHYEPPTNLDHTIFIEKERRDLCILCHEGINKSTVLVWKGSTHYNPKKNEYFARRTKQIEKEAGREINQVHCWDCHVNTEKNQIKMPTANDCSECHPREVEEFNTEEQYGRPSHWHGWEANVAVPWYPDYAKQYDISGMMGCDMCHATQEKCDICHTRHLFSAAEARKPEACVSCHMGPDHPDSETYLESKHGVIYKMQEEHYNWDVPLNQAVLGKDYRTPTCQICHMYQGGNRYTHNWVSKGIWRMGTVPPVNIEYESSLKDYPFGIKIIPGKVDPYSDENNAKRGKWNELCSKCHGPRFVEAYRETIDDFMMQAWKLHDKAQKVVDDVVAEGLLYPSVADRGAFPMGDVIADLLGPKLLGEPIYNAFKQTSGKVPVIGPILGVYTLFFSNNSNPQPIETHLAKMWFFEKLRGYKGVAHAQQDYAWWWGAATMLHEYTSIQAEAARLRREAEIEKRLSAIEARLK